METERNLFSRIPKNDHGRGGAWPFYWGAFYPKGGYRVQDAQLSMGINYERLEFGFYIGEYGIDQRERFLRNCAEHEEELLHLLRGCLSHDGLVYGELENSSGESALTWEEWIKDSKGAGIDVSKVLSKEEVLLSSEGQLVEQAAQTYRRLFPLVLLTISDDPIPEIRKYLDSIEECPGIPEYGLDQMSEDTGFEVEMLRRWVRAIERKGQAIVYGPPGTGKTFVTEHLARHLIGGGDGFAEIVQFHPEYAYEDFIQGIRPRTRSKGGLQCSASE